MSFVKKLSKSLKSHHLIALAGIIGLVILVNQIIKRKVTTEEANTPLTPAEYTQPAPSNPEGENGDFGSVEDSPVNSQVNATNPEELFGWETPASLPATFIVDPHNIIQHVSVNNLNVGRNPAETLRILDALQTDELCPCNRAVGGDTL